MTYIKLLRPANLLIIALTQLLFWFYIVEPVYAFFELETRLEHWQVLLLCLSTILIAAAGYVINDYYDLPIDLVNKPEKVLISREVSDNAAFNYYIILTVLGIVSALAVAVFQGQYTLVLLPVIVASLLWFYAQQFKRSFLVGNLIVALSTAAVIFILLLFEIDWQATQDESLSLEVNEILKFGVGYMLFAFLMTMLREIIKDLQDREGDEQFECRTLPIVWGEMPAKLVALFWLSLVVVLLSILDFRLFKAGNALAAGYLLAMLIIPGLFLAFRIIKADGSKDYQSISRWIKIMMFFGIITMVYIGIILGKHG